MGNWINPWDSLAPRPSRHTVVSKDVGDIGWGRRAHTRDEVDHEFLNPVPGSMALEGRRFFPLVGILKRAFEYPAVAEALFSSTPVMSPLKYLRDSLILADRAWTGSDVELAQFLGLTDVTDLATGEALRNAVRAASAGRTVPAASDHLRHVASVVLDNEISGGVPPTSLNGALNAEKRARVIWLLLILVHMEHEAAISNHCK